MGSVSYRMNMELTHKLFDMIIIGAGPSGCFLAKSYTDAGMSCLLLEAGKHFNRKTYPRKEVDANSQLYWSGGIELNKRADIGILRPKVVGGGSIVNQALLDRFDDLALDSWKDVSGVSFFDRKTLDPYYDQVLGDVHTQEIPAEYRNGNADIFIKGFKKNGYKCAPLVRAQKDCRYGDGNDCIECLAGCRIDSKQSSAITVLPKALANGLELISEFEVTTVESRAGIVRVTGKDKYGNVHTFRAGNLTLASGAIGNSKILLNSGFQKQNKNIGKNFYTHPQFMTLGLYDHKINAQKGPFQAMKSNDRNFRLNRFKLENVFGPPVAISMLLPGIQKRHQGLMKKITQMACIEVAIRDQNPGTIRVNSKGRVIIDKVIDKRDQATKDKGLAAIHNIFNSTGAREIIDGNFNIGLHLMGGCNMGVSGANSVIDPEFRLHGHKNIFSADSSIFPDAPGINPSLTIMALSKMAGEKIIGDLR
jgi:choline dehydrogenase-like flavoprotein